MDASLDTLSQIGGAKVEDSNEIVLGLRCKRITIKSQLGTTTYYFNEMYSINPADFISHRLEYWNFYTAKTKSVPLKIVFENKDVKMISTAVNVERMNLEDSVFKVPPGFLKKLF
jgi:hypothetical protein